MRVLCAVQCDEPMTVLPEPQLIKNSARATARLWPANFESSASKKSDAYGPEQVGGAIVAAPPRFIRTDSKSFEQLPIRSGPPGPLLEHLPDQAGFLVGLNVLEPVQNLPHALQVRRPLANGAPALKACDGTHPPIGEHFLGQEFSAGFSRGRWSLDEGLRLGLSSCCSDDAAGQYVQHVSGAFQPWCRRRGVAMYLGACMG